MIFFFLFLTYTFIVKTKHTALCRLKEREINKEMKRVFGRFCIMQAAYWSFYASLPGYITAYMLDQGMSAATLGILLALQMGAAFLGSIFWGRFVDRHTASRRFFLIGTLAVGILGVLLFVFAGTPTVLFMLYPLFGFMNGPIATTLDSWAIAAMHQVEAGAKSRTFGTLGFAFTMLLSGQVINRAGYGYMPYIALTLLTVGILTALSLPEVEREKTLQPKKNAADQETKSDLRQLLNAPKYLLLAAVVFFTGMAIGPINNMKVLIFESVGGDVSFLGWDAFIGCLIQSPFLIFSGKIRRIKSEYRLIGGAVAALAYALLVFLARNPVMVVMGTICTNISFGLLFPTMREITEESVSSDIRTSANSIIDVAYGSVANMIASAWSGIVMERFGTEMMSSICMGLECAAILFCVMLVSRSKKSSGFAVPSQTLAQRTCL